MAAIRIDKSLFSPEERAAYEALIAKASVSPEDNQEEAEEDLPPMPPRRGTPEYAPDEEDEEREETEKCATRTRKSADPVLVAALSRLDALEKSAEMGRMAEVAKKYAALGEDPDELAETLYALKKSDNPANYEAYLGVLDRSLDLVNKSGLFAEIGKSGHGAGDGSVQSRVEAAASEIQKADPGLTRAAAVAKAWEAHPDWIVEYDQEYTR